MSLHESIPEYHAHVNGTACKKKMHRPLIYLSIKSLSVTQCGKKKERKMIETPKQCTNIAIDDGVCT